jgi:hypothetical protein
MKSTPRERAMASSTSIEITYKVIEGFHIFEAEKMPGLYIAHRDARRAYRAVGPAIEKLIELDTGMSCRAEPDAPFEAFISKARADLTCAAAHQRFNVFKQAA